MKLITHLYMISNIYFKIFWLSTISKFVPRVIYGTYSENPFGITSSLIKIGTIVAGMDAVL